MLRLLTAAAIVLSLAGCATEAATGTPTPSAPSTPGNAVTFPAEDGVALHGPRLRQRHDCRGVVQHGRQRSPAVAGVRPIAGGAWLPRARATASATPSAPAASRRRWPPARCPTCSALLRTFAGSARPTSCSSGRASAGSPLARSPARSALRRSVVLSSPQDLSEYGLVVTPAELAALTAPKLFIASAEDTNVRIDETRTYFENAPEPKQFHDVPGRGPRCPHLRHGAR